MLSLSSCVNALNGLLAISTTLKSGEVVLLEMCQCPQRASSHFYQCLQERKRNRQNCDNAPNGLLAISTARLGRRRSVSMMCVNALNGLLAISTVASRKP